MLIKRWQRACLLSVFLISFGGELFPFSIWQANAAVGTQSIFSGQNNSNGLAYSDLFPKGQSIIVTNLLTRKVAKATVLGPLSKAGPSFASGSGTLIVTNPALAVMLGINGSYATPPVRVITEQDLTNPQPLDISKLTPIGSVSLPSIKNNAVIPSDARMPDLNPWTAIPKGTSRTQAPAGVASAIIPSAYIPRGNKAGHIILVANPPAASANPSSQAPVHPLPPDSMGAEATSSTVGSPTPVSATSNAPTPSPSAPSPTPVPVTSNTPPSAQSTLDTINSAPKPAGTPTYDGSSSQVTLDPLQGESFPTYPKAYGTESQLSTLMQTPLPDVPTSMPKPESNLSETKPDAPIPTPVPVKSGDALVPQAVSALDPSGQVAPDSTPKDVQDFYSSLGKNMETPAQVAVIPKNLTAPGQKPFTVKQYIFSGAEDNPSSSRVTPAPSAQENGFSSYMENSKNLSKQKYYLSLGSFELGDTLKKGIAKLEAISKASQHFSFTVALRPESGGSKKYQVILKFKNQSDIGLAYYTLKNDYKGITPKVVSFA